MKKLLGLLLVLCAAFTLAACGGKGIAGEWEFESLTMGEGTYKVGDEAPIGELTADYIVFTFEKDGTGKAVMTLGDESEETELEWEEDGDAFAIYAVEDGERDEEEKMSAKLEDGKLVISMGDGEYSMSYTLAKR